jgi:N-hydroxyarylamine O-acetyltransferase
MNLENYLKRIKSEHLTEISVENLHSLHANHLLNISFENFSIALNQYVKMNLDIIYDKVINRKRGGFCFELNQLFAWLLKELGYELKLVSCRTFPVSLQRYFPWNTHVALIVRLNNVEYLIDVGYSFSFRYPLEFVINKPQQDTIGHFRIEIGEAFDSHGKQLENVFTLSRTVNDLNETNVNWQIFYQFQTDPKRMDEFQAMLDWVQTSECARFFNRSFCLKHSDNSLYMLVVNTLTRWDFTNGVETSKEEREIDNDKLIETIHTIMNVNVELEFVPRNIQ